MKQVCPGQLLTQQWNLRSIKTGTFFSSWMSISFSRKTMHHATNYRYNSILLSCWLNRTIQNTHTTRLSCFSSLLVNSVKISRNGRFGGGPVGSSLFSRGFTENRIPSLCRAVMASRFFTASKPKDRANLFASSCTTKCRSYTIHLVQPTLPRNERIRLILK